MVNCPLQLSEDAALALKFQIPSVLLPLKKQSRSILLPNSCVSFYKSSGVSSKLLKSGLHVFVKFVLNIFKFLFSVYLCMNGETQNEDSANIFS